jgi:Ca2+-binding EF-hand superfamily protein
MKAHQAMFDAMDTNKDGMIDADEMKSAAGMYGAKKSADGNCGDMKK